MSNDERFNRLETKLDKLIEKQEDLNVTLVRNTESLEQHEYRTTLAERKLAAIDKDLKPIKAHVVFVKNLIKIVASAGAILLFLKELGII